MNKRARTLFLHACVVLLPFRPIVTQEASLVLQNQYQPIDQVGERFNDPVETHGFGNEDTNLQPPLNTLKASSTIPPTTLRSEGTENPYLDDKSSTVTQSTPSDTTSRKSKSGKPKTTVAWHAPTAKAPPTEDVAKSSETTVPLFSSSSVASTPQKSSETVPLFTSPIIATTAAKSGETVPLFTSPIIAITPAKSSETVPLFTSPIIATTAAKSGETVPLFTSPIIATTAAKSGETVPLFTSPIIATTPAKSSETVPLFTSPIIATTAAKSSETDTSISSSSTSTVTAAAFLFLRLDATTVAKSAELSLPSTSSTRIALPTAPSTTVFQAAPGWLSPIVYRPQPPPQPTARVAIPENRAWALPSRTGSSAGLSPPSGLPQSADLTTQLQTGKEGCICDYAKDWYCEAACAKARNTALWGAYPGAPDYTGCEKTCYNRFKRCCTICDYRVYYVGTPSQGGAPYGWIPAWDNYCREAYPEKYGVRPQYSSSTEFGYQ